LLHLFFQRSDRGGIQLTTVNHSDIRGLVTAWPGFVAELPLSEHGSFD